MLQKNPKIRALESVIKLPSLSKLLDIGCSTGDLTVYISNKLSIVQMFGVDIDDEALSKAKGIITYLLDISREKPPFTENSFEVCTMLDVIEYLENPDHVIKEVYYIGS